MSKELRCPSKLHLVLVNEDTIETSCNSKFCGKEAGTIVLHRWDLKTGTLISTMKFQATPNS